jgi:hypothetical protein
MDVTGRSCLWVDIHGHEISAFFLKVPVMRYSLIIVLIWIILISFSYLMISLYVSRIRPSGLFQFNIIFRDHEYFETFGRTPWTRDPRILHRTAQHRNTRTYSHVSSEIWTHDSSVRTVPDIRALEHMPTGTGLTVSYLYEDWLAVGLRCYTEEGITE